jgi:hypothetical protein
MPVEFKLSQAEYEARGEPALPRLTEQFFLPPRWERQLQRLCGTLERADGVLTLEEVAFELQTLRLQIKDAVEGKT